MRSCRWSFGVLLLGVALMGGVAGVRAQSADPTQQPAFRSGVEAVLVEVAVVDKQGHPVPGLGPEDFVVTVDGHQRRVVTAEFIDIEKAQAEFTPRPDVVPISTNEGGGVGRLVLFIVDSNTLDTGTTQHVAAAAERFFSRLTPADRSGLAVLPVGRNIAFTWAHERVRDALRQTAATHSTANVWEYGSLTEARDISTRGLSALREVALRECSATSVASGGGFGAPGQGGGQGRGQTPTPGTNQPGGTGTQPPPNASSDMLSASDGCLRQIQSEAQMAWTMARSTSLSSLSSLQHVFGALKNVPGDKTVVLISGGWPLDERDEQVILRGVADDAAAARATLFTVFVPHLAISASRRTISQTPHGDEDLHSWPMDTLAGMTGGRSFKANASAEWIFDRLARELGGYYRIGIEKNATDVAANGRPMRIKVARSGLSVRARGIFDVTTYEDRDWAARMASALESPVPATAVGLRLTSYVAADPEDPAYLRLVLVGDATRIQPGEATMRVQVRDFEGTKVSTGEQRLGEPDGSERRFATHLRVQPGNYIIRLAIMDATGRVGSVEHRVEVRPASVGGLAVTGPLLVQVPPGQAEPHFALDGVRQGDRLAIEVGLTADRPQLENVGVMFAIATKADGPALVEIPGSITPDASREGVRRAHAVVDPRLLPPGQYVARATIISGVTAIGEVRRVFTVHGRPVPAVTATSGSVDAEVAFAPSAATIRGRAASAVPQFAIDHVLAPQVLNAFLDRVAARPDAARPGAGELLDKARTTDIAHLNVSEAQAAQTPVAAFLKGLELLAQKKLDQAAVAFRSAMRAAPDFYPAMVYLGACYAAGGKDKEAANVWRTALIKEGDMPALHLLLSDALLRQGSTALAWQVVSAARARWPEDEGLKRRFVVAALVSGNYAAGLGALDELVARHAEDESSLELALLVLYESLTSGRAIDGADQDRARMVRLADAYRARGGRSMPLVETWLAAVKGHSMP